MDVRLTQSVRRLHGLTAELPAIRELLDYLYGAVHALARAHALNYRDRTGPLPGDYQANMLKRMHRAILGRLSYHGPWLAGFYFNSAIQRLAAAYHRTRRAVPCQSEGFKHAHLDKVNEDVDDLKHDI